jgi:hypothetical protein
MLGLGPLALVAVLVEPTTLLAVGTTVLYFAARALARVRNARRLRETTRELTAGALALLGVGLALFAVGRFLDLIGSHDPGLAVPKNQQVHMQVSMNQIVGELGSLVTPIRVSGYMPPVLDTLAVNTALRITDWLLLGGAVGGALVGGLDRRLRPLAVATFTVMVAGGPAFAAINALGDTFYPIPARYGLPLLPALMAILAGLLVTRVGRIVVGAFASGAAIASLLALG